MDGKKARTKGIALISLSWKLLCPMDLVELEEEIPKDCAPHVLPCGSSKHKQGQYDMNCEREHSWVYPSEDGRGMYCKLCKHFYIHNECNSLAFSTSHLASHCVTMFLHNMLTSTCTR